jgi:hypothetical protein
MGRMLVKRIIFTKKTTKKMDNYTDLWTLDSCISAIGDHDKVVPVKEETLEEMEAMEFKFMKRKKNPKKQSITPEETKVAAKEDTNDFKEPEFPEEYMIRMKKVEEQRKAEDKWKKEHICLNYKFIKYLRRQCPCKDRTR